MSPFLFAVYIECLRESGFGIMAFILAVYSVDVYYMVTTLYFFVLAVIVSGSYWIFVGTMVLNGTQSSLPARVLLVFWWEDPINWKCSIFPTRVTAVNTG